MIYSIQDAIINIPYRKELCDMYNVKDIGKVKENWRHFWNHDFIGRPYLCITVPNKETGSYRYNGSYGRRVKAARERNMLPLLKDFENHAKSIIHLGESLPSYSVDICPDQYAMFFGAPVTSREGQYTNWVSPIADELCELDLTFDRNNEAVLALEYAMREAAEFADGKFLIRVPDYHCNLDTLSALLSPQNLCYELIDNPKLLEQKLDQINGAFDQIYNIFYKAGKMDTQGSVGWLPLYCEGRSSVLQCDFSCMISPSDARKYVIPSLERELDSLDHSVYHYDGSGALGHFEDILSLERLDCLQWKCDPGEKTYDRMHLLTRAQEKGKSLWVYDWTAEEILADTKLDPTLTVFSLSMKSEEEALEFIEKLEQKYRS